MYVHERFRARATRQQVDGNFVLICSERVVLGNCEVWRLRAVKSSIFFSFSEFIVGMSEPVAFHMCMALLFFLSAGAAVRAHVSMVNIIRGNIRRDGKTTLSFFFFSFLFLIAFGS